LQSAPGESLPVAGVYVRLDLYAHGNVIANLSLGLTDVTGSLSLPRATLEAVIARYAARLDGPAQRQLAEAAPTARVAVIGANSFDRLCQIRAELGLEPSEQGWIAQATNARLASEFADVPLTSALVSVNMLMAPRGGVNSQARRQHALSLRSALLASGVLVVFAFAGAAPQARYAGVLLPLAAAWLAYEAWWRWRYRANSRRSEAGAA
jgi:hypothetical protein